MSDRSFVHLHVHTEYSMLDGAAQLKPLFTEAARLEMPAIGMTDHGNMFGAYAFYKQAQSAGVKPVIGIEAYLAPHDRFHKKPVFWGDPSQRSDDLSGNGAYTHMTMLARNAQGLHNLFALSSRASIEGYYYKPRMDRTLVAEHAEGIIATTGCPSGEVQTRLRLGQFDEALQAAADYRDIFGAENFFCEVMDHGLDIENRVREGLKDIAGRLNLRWLATNDSHYVTQDQASAHEALLCVQSGKTLDDPKRFKFDGDGYYLKSAAEMREMFDAELPGACDSTLLIAERVESYDSAFAHQNRMPIFDVPEGHTEETWLHHEVFEGLGRRFPNGLPEGYAERAEYELSVINGQGFPAYFLVVADLCNYARANGIRVGPGRGSAAGALVAYALGITNVDPIEHTLLFERFLNPDRISMPDIDIDFDDRRRGEMITYATNKYGADKVAQVITFGTIKAKAALKDAARILYGPAGFGMADKISKAMPPAVLGKDITLKGIVDPNDSRHKEATEVRSLLDTDPNAKKIFDTARGLEGLIRQPGVHACAVILSKDPIIDVIPVWARPADGAMITGFDYPSCEDIGLLKMDFLGLRNLTVMGDAIDLVKANRGIDIDLDTVPIDDPATYELLQRGDTLGVFQLDGSAMRELLRRMAPTEFADISAVSALYRPGPMAMNAHNDYADRKNARQEVKPIHQELAISLQEILAPTYGLIVYQEQIMKIAQKVAGFTAGQADVLRKAMGKKKLDVLEKEFARFSEGMKSMVDEEAGITAGYTDEAIKTLWDTILPFAGYAFNKSHAVAYGMVSYWTAYLKANYPAEYMAALLTSVGDSKDKAAVYLAECRKMGIKVLPPDVNDSIGSFSAVGEDIRFGMGAIRNVGENVVASIVKCRKDKGAYENFQDFLSKVDAVVCNKRAIESLVKAGAFDSLGHTRRGLAEVHEQAIDAMMSIKKEEAKGQFDLFGDMFAAEDASTTLGVDLTVPEHEWDKRDLLTFEREMLGLYVSSHPLVGYERLLSANSDKPIAALFADDAPDGAMVMVSGILTGVAKRVTKQGKLWASASIEDLEGGIEVRFFPATYEAVGDYLAEDLVCCVKAKLDKREGTPQLIAQDLRILDVSSQDKDGAAGPVTLSLRAQNVTESLVRKLQETLMTHRGESEVRVKLLGGGPSPKMFRLSPAWRVTPSTSLAADIKALLGAGALELEA
ncbi:DNA-directed DNA polymerase [Actinorhabdospora filicis]|uniref:DNA polymerase III subunit alpha n=1 Tax=Actinorhabdospora filicis TaxID=1785913 RepID=A0A9W6SKH8_9ACTN|nr:DNA polymerase III subunit alpha [Actinorhabdospora filicis]GLZ77334.1 DNA-directed DNA polymerase [Actinorhabdospora filicis]